MMPIRHSLEQIIRKLREADVELAKGTAVPEICMAQGIAENTYWVHEKIDALALGDWLTLMEGTSDPPMMPVPVLGWIAPPDHGVGLQGRW